MIISGLSSQEKISSLSQQRNVFFDCSLAYYFQSALDEPWAYPVASLTGTHDSAISLTPLIMVTAHLTFHIGDEDSASAHTMSTSLVNLSFYLWLLGTEPRLPRVFFSFVCLFLFVSQ